MNAMMEVLSGNLVGGIYANPPVSRMKCNGI